MAAGGSSSKSRELNQVPSAGGCQNKSHEAKLEKQINQILFQNLSGKSLSVVPPPALGVLWDQPGFSPFSLVLEAANFPGNTWIKAGDIKYIYILFFYFDIKI